MLFSSYDFLLLFLPTAVVGFYALGRLGGAMAALVWLLLCSFFFYGWWSPAFLFLLIASCAVNAALGYYLTSTQAPRGSRRSVAALGIAFNLGTLIYFKYAGFIASNVEAVTGRHFDLGSIVLPLGISFFVFQKIAFLADAYRNEVEAFSIRRFFLFVFFFPQLIAGPIVHHREIMPQMNEQLGTRVDWAGLAMGLTIFIVGLFKKTVIADGIGPYATSVFDAAASGTNVPFVEAWCGTLAYTFQLYFDFSGYSDMAIGLALLFGLRLPVNFASPYKAASLIDFWHRWHITLSRFLRDYLYIPLGGGRTGTPRRLANVLIVMMLGGFWHGAGWTFLLWGTLHGIGLIANHAWRLVRGPRGGSSVWAGRIATFMFVALAWIPFRAADLDSTMLMFRGVFGLNGIVLPETYLPKLGAIGAWAATHGVTFETGHLFQGVQELAWLAVLLAAVWLLPNTAEWARYSLVPERAEAPRAAWLTWRPTLYWAGAVSAGAVVALLHVGRGGEFLYFQF